MGIHRYNQRGRTRQPKNLVLNHHDGTSGAPITFEHFKASGSIGVLESSNHLSGNLDSTVAASNGYDTENQKFLHLCLSQSTGDSRSVTLYGYNRQFGVWGKLKQRIGHATASAGTFMESVVDLTISSEASTTTYITVPIEGVDRVGFVSADTTGLFLYVAGSTL